MLFISQFHSNLFLSARLPTDGSVDFDNIIELCFPISEQSIKFQV